MQHQQSPVAGWRIKFRHALIAGTVFWLLFGVTAALVMNGSLAGIDNWGLIVLRTGPDRLPWGPPWLLEAVRDWTALGGVLLRNLVALVAITALLFARLRRDAFLLAATIGSGWIVNSLVKQLIGRPRPAVVSHLTEAGGASFPSGHSFNSAVVYLTIGLAFASLSPRRTVRWTIIASAAMMTALISLSRVWLGVHYPSDALAGWLGGMAWAFTASALLHRPTKSLVEYTPDNDQAADSGP